MTQSYLRALARFRHASRVVGFEDTLRGCSALQAAGVSAVTWLTPPGSCCSMVHGAASTSPMAEGVFQVEGYGSKDFPWAEIVHAAAARASHLSSQLTSFIVRAHNQYSHALSAAFGSNCDAKAQQQQNLRILLPLVKSCRGRILLAGIGKSGLVAAKSASTWQSMGICTGTLNVTDLFHGDFGGISSADMIVYISNSGNTEELVRCATYIRKEFSNVQVRAH